ncbi:MAG: acyl-CoA dehydrogenase family protein [Elusimicrobia bacterium]|nr:acyl-CoA dehydrogenase family protein [Elusimicrobiota bacterium]
MDYDLTEEQRGIVETAREIAQKKIKPVAKHYDETEEFPWPIVEEIRKADLFSIYLPEEFGGMGGGITELCLAAEEMYKACGGITMAYGATSLCASPILLFGNPDQRKRWLPDLAAGKRLGAFNITEPGAGSDATATKATARLEGDHYVVNGIKNFCTNGKEAELYVIFASTNPARGPRGISAFVVEKGTPGFTFGKKEEKLGIRASSTYELVFQDCKVPKENLLYKEGYGLFVAQAVFDQSRPGVAAQALGVAQGALDETVAYIRQRKQFGQSVSSFQAMQHMLADCATAIECGRALLYKMTRAMDKVMKPAIEKGLREGIPIFDAMQALDTPRFTKEAGMVKVFATDAAMKITTDCIQMCGGIGYMRDFPVEKYFRDAKVLQIYEGTNQIQRNEIAMMLIKEAASKSRRDKVSA